MKSLLPIIVIGVFAVIVLSLGSALWHLVRGAGDSRRVLRALSWRIGLSIALFVLLMVAWYAGLIAPHGVDPMGRH
ncbi:MAG TPA: twin transmembrane helix small protein [Steroidobacteraceae bacterium]